MIVDNRYLVSVLKIAGDCVLFVGMCFDCSNLFLLCVAV